MTEPQARSWAGAAAAAGMVTDALFVAFYASFAVQHFTEPRGVTACDVLTVTGLLPAVSAVAAGAVLASIAWLLAIGIRGADLPGPQLARVARTARLIAATLRCSGVGPWLTP